ncbi:ABC transporter permease [Agromyces bauzanensis]
MVSIEAPMFREPESYLSVIKQSAFIAIVAVGQFVVILGGGIDLSVGATVKVSAILSAMVMAGQDANILPAIAVAVGVGLLVGLVNGFLVVVLRVAPFIATFGVFYVLTGVAYLISSAPAGRVAPALYDFYTLQWFGIDTVNWLLAALWIVAGLLFTRLVYIKHLTAVGGNASAARLSGIQVGRTMIISYVVCSMLAALAGVYVLLRSGVAGPTTGDGLELTVITAVIIGGVSLMGGRGSILGVLGGVLLMQMIIATFDFLQVDSLYQQLAKGLLILLAVAIWKAKERH